ncbi:NADPH-dependent oxidoreductase [Corallococcus sp. CA049B]|uniref:NADPH-dependent FMN reductase n=1 Tax=Corallococcus sp. CA049B TaxID=2316730 RepID=UPI000EA33B0B|nr:NAD(P)H-dependent oxidoreductase [Corallococcus sp. CA049B]NOJ97944.1 NAD(P)H-dependent oxidoreductase [Corallococcus coralloides]RKG76026.1 NADPH-dependent oxidoreductase [Corallococcus sp. CA049B]
MIKVAIVVGSTRPGRKADKVATWVHDIAKKRSDATYELVDIQDFHLPLLDEPTPPSAGKYTQEHTKKWSAAVEGYDAYVFVTPEYNHGPSGALKNALDYVYKEWNNKAAGFVGYGSAGGVRAVEQLRLVAAELQLATVRAQVQLFLSTDFEHYTVFKPDPAKEKQVNTLLDQLVSWGTALRTVRVKA